MERLEQIAKEAEPNKAVKLDDTVKKMGEYSNPVELVNNMYGCHPDAKGSEYFTEIYGKQE